MARIQIQGFQCERCDHKWCPKSINQQKSKFIDPPIICPTCKSPYWDKPRKNKNTKFKKEKKVE